MKSTQRTGERFLRVAVILVALLTLLCSGIMSSCSMPGAVDSQGTLRVQVIDAVARTLVPTISMVVDRYRVQGLGPNGEVFDVTTSTSEVDVPWLRAGDWTVSVDALNDAGLTIGQGSGTVRVLNKSTQDLAVMVRPLAGTGTLSLSVTWDTAEVADPTVEAQLIPASGEPSALAFGAVEGVATSEASAVDAGYATLVVQMKDEGVLVAGAVEIVRIVAGATTEGAFAFDNLNRAGGSIWVNITPDMGDPLEVTMTGQVAALVIGSSMTVTATVPAGVGTVVTVWYLNGEPCLAAESITVGADLACGYYRLDATVFTADGRRAGSASHSFNVTF